MEKQTYLAGDLLKKGSIMLRNVESEELRNVGVKIYSPIEDKSINDKNNQTEESNNGLAERIVRNDTKAILESDIIVIEPQDDAKGTMVELGQLKGMKDASIMINEILNKHKDTIKYIFNTDEYISLIIEDLQELSNKLDKKVYPHYEDIRRMDLPEVADRRSWSVNQYVYGVCLDLTDGIGFYEWEDIVKELEQEYIKDWQKEYIELANSLFEKCENDNIKIMLLDVNEIMLKYGLNKDEMYSDIYRINDLKFNSDKRSTFVSNYYKTMGYVELSIESKLFEK